MAGTWAVRTSGRGVTRIGVRARCQGGNSWHLLGTLHHRREQKVGQDVSEKRSGVFAKEGGGGRGPVVTCDLGTEKSEKEKDESRPRLS